MEDIRAKLFTDPDIAVAIKHKGLNVKVSTCQPPLFSITVLDLERNKAVGVAKLNKPLNVNAAIPLFTVKARSNLIESQQVVCTIRLATKSVVGEKPESTTVTVGRKLHSAKALHGLTIKGACATSTRDRLDAIHCIDATIICARLGTFCEGVCWQRRKTY